MDALLYYLVSAIIGLLQALPLGMVARIGRFFGGLFYLLDARHRRVARRNLAMCFPEKSMEEVRRLARENFKRVGENFASAVKTSAMTLEQLNRRVEIIGLEKLYANPSDAALADKTSLIFAIGHFGNFEIFANVARQLPGYHPATTYRAVRQRAVNRIMLRLRESTGCLYFERRTQGGALRTALREKKLVLGLLSDQNSGDHGVRLPFFGHDCNTTKAPAVYALRFGLPLFTAIGYRTRIGHWRIEVGDRIPTHFKGDPRSISQIMGDVNRAFEVGVRCDPANWFWVHNRWKKSSLKAASRAPDELELEESQTEIPPTKHAAPE